MKRDGVQTKLIISARFRNCCKVKLSQAHGAAKSAAAGAETEAEAPLGRLHFHGMSSANGSLYRISISQGALGKIDTF